MSAASKQSSPASSLCTRARAGCMCAPGARSSGLICVMSAGHGACGALPHDVRAGGAESCTPWQRHHRRALRRAVLEAVRQPHADGQAAVGEHRREDGRPRRVRPRVRVELERAPRRSRSGRENGVEDGGGVGVGWRPQRD
eukprot:1522487-Prymnesium_polylepis.1